MTIQADSNNVNDEIVTLTSDCNFQTRKIGDDKIHGPSRRGREHIRKQILSTITDVSKYCFGLVLRNAR